MAIGYVRLGGSVVKNPPANAGAAGNMGLIPEYRIFPGEENGNPLQDSCLDNPMDRGVWQAYSLWDHKESNKNERLSRHANVNQ